MEEKIISITPEQVIAAYKEHKPKSVDGLTYEGQESPLSGTIIKFDPNPRVYQDNKYFVFIVDDNGTEKELSVSRLTDSFVTENVIQQVRNENSENVGRWMLKTSKVTNISIFPKHKNQAELISKMVGKTFTAERISKPVLVKYTADKLFTPKKKQGEEPTDAQKKALWANTAISDKLFKFLTIE